MTTKEARERLIALEHEHTALRAEVADLTRQLTHATVCIMAYRDRHHVMSGELRKLQAHAHGIDLEQLAHAFAARSFAPEVYDDVE